ALERAYLANAAHSGLIRDTTARVIDALNSADIQALLLKGAALVETAYPNPAEREMLDIDVLVPEARMAEATATLSALGYQPNLDSEADAILQAPRSPAVVT